VNDESDLYALAMRLIPLRRFPHAKVSHAQLLVGQLPAGLPFELPVPPSARVIGTVIDGHFATVFLESDLPPKDVIAYYHGELTGQGWTMMDGAGGASPGGFVLAHQSHALFCRMPEGPRLRLYAYAYPEAPSEVGLDLDLTPGVPCERRAGPRGPQHAEPPQPPPAPSMPELAAPAGSDFQNAGGQANSVASTVYGELTTSLDLGAVATHYADQLRAAGAVLRGHGQDGMLAWNSWELRDPEHGPNQALFLAVRQPDEPNTYFLFLRVRQAS
jgi:hypothetical protein